MVIFTGSNGVVANYGWLHWLHTFVKDPSYLESSIHFDYLLRNATGMVRYKFVKINRNPHHRPSTADGIPDPIPGFLVGGPNNQSRSGVLSGEFYPIFRESMAG